MPSPTGLMKQAASASSDEGTESTASALSTDAASSRRRARRRTEFVTLDREMELVSLATNDQGQRVRNVPRRQWKNRTKKRKVLEKEDVKEHAIEAGEVRKRLRGSRVAFEDEGPLGCGRAETKNAVSYQASHSKLQLPWSAVLPPSSAPPGPSPSRSARVSSARGKSRQVSGNEQS